MQSLCHHLLFGIVVVVGVVCVGGLESSSPLCKPIRDANKLLCFAADQNKNAANCQMNCLCLHGSPNGTCSSDNEICNCSNDNNLTANAIAGLQQRDCDVPPNDGVYKGLLVFLCPIFGFSGCENDCICVHNATGGECVKEGLKYFDIPVKTCKCKY